MYTYAIQKRRAHFTRRGFHAFILENGVACHDTPFFQAYQSFYGNDGRTVRADAVRWAKARCAELNRRAAQ